MFDSAIVDTAIGLSMVFALFALLTTSIQEILATWFHSRAVCLRRGICNLLDAGHEFAVADVLYSHPLIRTISNAPRLPYTAPPAVLDIPARELPSYIPSVMFASVLLDTLSRQLTADSDDPRSLAVLRRAIEANGPFSRSNLGRVMLHLIARADRRTVDGDGEKELLEEISAWYEAVMERVSGWYKRYTQWQVLWIGFVLAGAMNIDAIHLAVSLHRDPDMRARAAAAAQLLSTAQQQGFTEPSADTSETVRLAVDSAASAARQLIGSMQDAGMPVGWKAGMIRRPNNWEDLRRGVLRVLGWVVVAISGLIGAPLWFDLLQKFITIRGAGTKPAPKTSGGEKDNSAGDRGAGSHADLVAASGPPVP